MDSYITYPLPHRATHWMVEFKDADLLLLAADQTSIGTRQRTDKVFMDFRNLFAIPFYVFFLSLVGCASTLKRGHIEVGEASYYGQQYHGRKTASGEIFDMNQLTAAHRTLPMGTKVRVVNSSGQSVVVRINDRGPFVRGRIIDVSLAAAKKLALTQKGVDRVTVEVLSIPSK